ncbi:MAG: hypothetical protein JOZ16_00640 [Methylobacteriaceae bacterium]|nr:hypothetical protein [Methylobacteriaceae bacterium]
MTEEDARARRDHAQRSGSATEYDALLGFGPYAPERARLRALIERLFRPAKTPLPDARKRGSPAPW